ncbi:MAG: uracil-xanthine permease family protein [Oscillospiraceae bacterium]
MSSLKQLKPRDYLLSIQHLFAMFGATVLVPLITGLNPSTALLSAGIGTLLFHLCTKGQVPVFLGSSFAFLGAISIYAADGTIDLNRLPKVQGGIIIAGCVYLIFALIAYLVGSDNIKRVFPPVVTGPVIVVIGIQLSSTAITDCGFNGVLPADTIMKSEYALNFGIAFFTLAVVIICSIFAKGFFKLVPILIGLASGYVLCIILCACGVLDWSYMNFDAIRNAEWFNIPFKSVDGNGVQFMTLPQFDLTTILSIAPIALVTFMEHIGDITTNSTVVGKDFLKDPGLHRTLMGDGIATIFAGLIGGPANTTYSENTGVLATTKNYNPLLLRITACFAIILAFFGKFGAVLQTIPCAVKGGVEIMLFGMIAAVGIRTLAEAKLDFTNSRNLIIVGVILTTGLGINTIGGIRIPVGSQVINISGLFVAVLVGVIANLVLPNKPDTEESDN